jgi:hypothetical protein
MDDSGILYVLTNPFMPGLVKIGCTTGPVEERIKGLSSATGVPVAFQCTVLSLSRDEDVHATVVSGNKVEFEGQIMSLSASALAALHKLGGYTLATVSGSDYWMYEGKTLDDIRVAKEAENESDWLTELEADSKNSASNAAN